MSANLRPVEDLLNTAWYYTWRAANAINDRLQGFETSPPPPPPAFRDKVMETIRAHPWITLSTAVYLAAKISKCMKNNLKHRTVLEINLDKLTLWQTLPEIGQSFVKDAVNTKDLLQLAIVAACDERFSGLVVHYTATTHLDPHTLTAVREAILAFRSACNDSKPCVFYTLSFGYSPAMVSYYLASACTRIYMPSDGLFVLSAPRGVGLFARKLVEDKGEAKFDVATRAEYKSAGEILTRDSFSEPARENMESLAARVWSEVAAAVLGRPGLRLPTARADLSAFKISPAGMQTREGVVPLSSADALSVAGGDGWISGGTVTTTLLAEFLDANVPMTADVAAACGFVEVATKADVYNSIIPRLAKCDVADVPTTTPSAAVKAAAAAAGTTSTGDGCKGGVLATNTKTPSTASREIDPTCCSVAERIRLAMGCKRQVEYSDVRTCLKKLGGPAVLYVGGRVGPTCLPPRTVCERLCVAVGSIVKPPPRVVVVSLEGSIHLGKSRRWYDSWDPHPRNQSIGHATASGLLRSILPHKDIEGVILVIESRGGCAFASAEVARAVEAVKAAGKKVVVLMKSVAASGGYYIPCPADYVVAEPLCVVGSVGVVFMSPVLRTFFRERLGLTFDHTSTATPSAASFASVLDGMDETAKESRERTLDAIYASFTSIVAKHRGMTQSEVDSVARGRVFMARDGVGAKLVDEVGSYHAVYAAMRRLLGLAADAPLRVEAFPAGSFSELMGWKEESSESGPLPLGLPPLSGVVESALSAKGGGVGGAASGLLRTFARSLAGCDGAAAVDAVASEGYMLM